MFVDRGSKKMKVKSYKELKVWNKGLEITDKVYEASAKFPKEETYGLSAQIQRAAVSIPSNIAEGFMRQHTKEYVQFLHIALGSCAELETQLIISGRRGYLTQDVLKILQEEIDHQSRMLMNLIKTLR